MSEIKFDSLVVDAIEAAYIHAVMFCFIDLFSDHIQTVTVQKFELKVLKIHKGFLSFLQILKGWLG